MRLDGMDSVAISAHRGLAVATGDRLAVNALHELLLHGFVTLGAGGGHVEAKDGRVLVGGRENFVRAVTVGADRRLLRACRHGFSLDTLLTRDFGSLAGNSSWGLP